MFLALKEEHKYSFSLIEDFFSDSHQDIFNIYGGIIEDNICYNSTDYEIKIRIVFYELLHPELINRKIVKEFETLFLQAYFIINNTLKTEYYDYEMSIHNNNMCKPRIYDTSYLESDKLKTKLYNYQKNNIAFMKKTEENGVDVEFNHDILFFFDNGITYNFNKNEFIESGQKEIHKIYGGIICDSHGLGKTYPMLTISVDNLDIKTLILVPDHIIDHWIDQFKKHIVIPYEKLYDKITIVSFTDFEKSKIPNNYDRVIIDEIHELERKYQSVRNKILTYTFKYRWGLTATPFITEESLYFISIFLTGAKYINQRIVNEPRIQTSFMQLFIKNTHENTYNEVKLQKLNIHNQLVYLDHTQQTIYDTEKKTMNGTLNLRHLLCDIESTFNNNQNNSLTPSELKKTILIHYKTEYETRNEELEVLKSQQKNLIETYTINKSILDVHTFNERINHYEMLISDKEKDVRNYKTAYEYFNSNINTIEKIVTSDGETLLADENCGICLNTYTPPISYIKQCGHFFCKECFDYLSSINRNNVKCPICRKENGDILIVNNIVDINSSSKTQEVINILQKTNNRFLIFTQFPKIIPSLLIKLTRNNISAIEYNVFKKTANKDDCQVIILSSETNASGIDMSFISNIIIFEPFENEYYCQEIEKQLIGRCYRIGQTNEVNVYRYICKDTIEEEIYSKFI